MTRENYMKIPVPVKHKGGFTGTQPRTLASSVSPEVASEPPSPEAARPTRPKAPTLWPLMELGLTPTSTQAPRWDPAQLPVSPGSPTANLRVISASGLGSPHLPSPCPLPPTPVLSCPSPPSGPVTT